MTYGRRNNIVQALQGFRDCSLDLIPLAWLSTRTKQGEHISQRKGFRTAHAGILTYWQPLRNLLAVPQTQFPPTSPLKRKTCEAAFCASGPGRSLIATQASTAFLYCIIPPFSSPCRRLSPFTTQPMPPGSHCTQPLSIKLS